MKTTYAVIGLDTFGVALTKEIARLGGKVIAFDRNENHLNLVSDVLERGAVFDYTNEAMLIEMGIKHVDHAIVSISGDIQSSILVTLILKEIGVAKVTVCVENEYHEKVVTKLGADLTVSPNILTGMRIARRLMNPNILDYYSIDDKYGLYEIKIRPDFIDKPLFELDLRNKFNINIVLIKRGKEIIIPKASDILMHDDIAMIIGTSKAITKFQNEIS